ncbi:hypothetical protein BGZ83_005431 [Gryganskiella cystojenkinii]|nr:hypothetical protein BGZ83_005431 [Gryganskiella cystojenkinii]
MSQSTARSDHSSTSSNSSPLGPQSSTLSQTQQNSNNHSNSNDQDPALNQITSERNSLRSQNDQLWKIIEKQRIIIQNLQKDLAKAVSERDLLRNHLTAEHSTFRSNSLNSLSSASSGASSLSQINGHHQHSKRSLERKTQQDNIPSSTAVPAETLPQQQHRSHHHSSISENSHHHFHHPQDGISLTSVPATADVTATEVSDEAQPEEETQLETAATSSTDDLQPGQTSSFQIQDPVQLAHPDQALTDVVVVSEEGQLERLQERERDLGQQQSFPATTVSELEPISRPSYDEDGQAASMIHWPYHQHHQASALASPVIVLENDLHSNQSLPTSASLTSPHMPHLPPRSPRRERRDMGDNTPSPAASDNEDDTIQSPVNRSKMAAGAPKGRGELDQTSPLAPSRSNTAHATESQEADEQAVAATKASVAQGGGGDGNLYPNDAAFKMELEAQKSSLVGMGKAARKNISAQIPVILSTGLGPSRGSMDPSPASPSAATGSISTPASPIAAIIDQDAEKFRMYMSKLNSPSRRNVSAPIQTVDDKQDLASALGQAVAMENIQNQIDIQNQLMGQVQSHGGRGLNPIKPQQQLTGRDTFQQPQSKISAEYGEGSDHGTLADSIERNASQLSLPSDARIKKRDSSLHLADDSPKALSRSASQQREDAESSFNDHGVPSPPRRYDSHGLLDQSQSSENGRPTRVASPTPSGNSSLTNTVTSAQPPTSQSRSAPTFHQQAFSMFADNLEFVSVLVVGSNIRTNDRGKEQLTFLISIGQEVQGLRDEVMYPHKESDELWRVEKQYSDFVNLDAKLRVTQSRNIINSLPKLPEKSLFNNHAPSKVDARKVALEQYLQQITSLRIKDTRDLCEFLSTNVVERENARQGRGAGWKEGYLTKRGKNFGGWKTRYFILKGPVLEYLDSKDGHHLGSISLTNAQIGRQQTPERSQESPADGTVDPNSYRHAFLILEPKKGQTVLDAKKNPNNVIRHVLCAETDQDRDQWVDALMVYVGKEPSESFDSADRDRPGKRLPEIQKLSATPIKDLSSSKADLLTSGSQRKDRQMRPTSSSYKPSPESQSGSPFTTPGDPSEKKKSRMTFWPKKKEDAPAPMPNSMTGGQNGSQQTTAMSPSQPTQDSSRLKYFLGKSSGNPGSGSGGSASNVLPPSTAPSSSSYPSSTPARQVFGVPLEQAIEQARVQPGYELPAVVYRCIEYLNAHRAKMEEGIYRLNGSSAVIKNLKERFNQEGDVQLLACEEYYDIHAVAGLLKLYLRDLPSSVLTRELHKDFLQVVELSSRGDRVDELTRLVAGLPEANYTILRALTAHLIEIVDNADVNKMTARNVGIVFSPTLGIPAGVFSLLMSDFDQIFHTSDGRIMPLENSDVHDLSGVPDTSFDSLPTAPI